MINLGILIEFYFTKYLFMAMTVLGIMCCIKYLMMGRK